MFNTFYVIDQNNNTSADDEGHAEYFDNRQGADKRAEHLANNAPGDFFDVVQTIGRWSCPVGAAVLDQGEKAEKA